MYVDIDYFDLLYLMAAFGGMFAAFYFIYRNRNKRIEKSIDDLKHMIEKINYKDEDLL